VRQPAAIIGDEHIHHAIMRSVQAPGAGQRPAIGHMNFDQLPFLVAEEGR
jgi:hypothetical protein